MNKATRFLFLTLFATTSFVMDGAASSVIHTLSGRAKTTAEMDKFVADEINKLSLVGVSIAVINDGKIV